MKVAKSHSDNTIKEIDFGNPKKVAAVLAEVNKWRRGIGKYKWNEVPEKNVNCPYTASQFGLALDAAVEMLKGIGKTGKNGVGKYKA